MNECSACGAAMADESRHRRWHDAIATDFDQLRRKVRTLEEKVLNPRR